MHKSKLRQEISGRRHIEIIDMPGHTRHHGAWFRFNDLISGIVFVVDLSDAIRFAVARTELDNIIRRLGNSLPVVILLSKSDALHAVSESDFWHDFDIASFGHKQWISKVVGLGEKRHSMDTAMIWLVDQVTSVE